jgi:hypothetical protein
MLDFAGRVYNEQLALAGGCDGGKRRPCVTEWGPAFQQQERELNSLFAVGIREADRTGFSVEEVERRLRRFQRPILDILLWPQKAPPLSEEECREREEGAGYSGGPVSDYLSKHISLMMDAWQDVEVLAYRLEPPRDGGATAQSGPGPAVALEHPPMSQTLPDCPDPPGDPLAEVRAYVDRVRRENPCKDPRSLFYSTKNAVFILAHRAGVLYGFLRRNDTPPADLELAVEMHRQGSALLFEVFLRTFPGCKCLYDPPGVDGWGRRCPCAVEAVLDFARRLSNEARRRRCESVQDRPDDLPIDALLPLSPGWATTLIDHEFARLEPSLHALESRPGPAAEAQATTAGDQRTAAYGSAQPATGPRKKRMSVEVANQKALQLARGRGFWELSVTKQAKRIGCAFETWKKTQIFQDHQRRQGAGKDAERKRDAAASRYVVGYSTAIEETTPAGGPKSVLDGLIQQEDAEAELRRLTEEQAAEAAADPSPLDKVARQRPKKYKRA